MKEWAKEFGVSKWAKLGGSLGVKTICVCWQAFSDKATAQNIKPCSCFDIV